MNGFSFYHLPVCLSFCLSCLSARAFFVPADEKDATYRPGEGVPLRRGDSQGVEERCGERGDGAWVRGLSVHVGYLHGRGERWSESLAEFLGPP